MMRRRQSRLTYLLSALLLSGAAVIPSSMALVAAGGNAPSGHHDGHSHTPGKAPPTNCCDLCSTTCETAPGVSPRAELPVVLLTVVSAPAIAPTGLLATTPVEHRLPFAQGPPAFLS